MTMSVDVRGVPNCCAFISDNARINSPEQLIDLIVYRGYLTMIIMVNGDHLTIEARFQLTYIEFEISGVVVNCIDDMFARSFMTF